MAKCKRCGSPAQFMSDLCEACMDRPSDDTSDTVTPPPHRAQRRPVNVRRLGWIVLLVALVGGLKGVLDVYSGKSARENLSRSIDQGTIAKDLGIHDTSPYEFMNRSLRSAGPSFGRSFATGFSNSILQGSPGSDLRFDDTATFEELGGILRATIRYRGQLADERKLDAVEAEARRYFHSEGSVELDGLCYTALSTCDDLAERLDAAEVALLKQITSSSVGGILPASGDCSIEPTQNQLTHRSVDVASCFYKPGTLVSLTRSNLAEFRDALEANSREPVTKELMRRRLQGDMRQKQK